VTGKYRRAAHHKCNLKLKLKAKTVPILVVFHNFKGDDGHLLMQAMARVQGEIKCIATNTEKCISFSLGDLMFIDSELSVEQPRFSGKRQRPPVFQNNGENVQ